MEPKALKKKLCEFIWPKLKAWNALFNIAPKRNPKFKKKKFANLFDQNLKHGTPCLILLPNGTQSFKKIL